MRFTGAIACGIVALDCADKATGTAPQILFAPANLWVWWVAAALWSISCTIHIWGKT